MHLRFMLIDILAVISGGTALAAWQEQIEWGVRLTAGIVAITAGLLSIYWHFRARRTKRSKSLD